MRYCLTPVRLLAISESVASLMAGAIGVQSFGCTQFSVETRLLEVFSVPLASLKLLASGATTQVSCSAAVPSMKSPTSW